jgi:KDO2-lipid IV(A) lauroyltransferase
VLEGLFRIVCRLIGLLPPRWLDRVGSVLGFVAFSLLRVRRRVTLDNLGQALGLPRRQTLAVARRVYAHLCTGALEFVQLVGRHLTEERAREALGAAGLDRLQRALAPGRGLLVLGAHLGNWDLLACAAARCGVKVNVVTRSIKSTWLNRYWMSQRAACGVRLLPASGSGWAVVAALRRNEVVAMVLDQHEPGGLVVPFFGRPAATGTGLARLARATGTPVLPAFLLRESAGGRPGYRLELDAPLHVARTADREADLLEATRRMTKVVEDHVRACPEQWLWLHRRWKVDSPPHARIPTRTQVARQAPGA